MDDKFQPLARFMRKGADLDGDNYRAAHIAVMSRYDNAEIPKDYQGIMLEDSPAKEDQKTVYDALESYVATFTQDIRHKSVYLYSKTPGTGKTTTSAALMSEFIRRRFLYYAKNGDQVPETLALFCDINEMQTKYNLASMSNSDTEMGRIRNDIERYSNVEFLVMDDVGVRSSSESFRSLIHSIINRRVTENRATVFTSNVLLGDLDTVFDARLRDRISDQNVILTFKGDSKRGRRTK